MSKIKLVVATISLMFALVIATTVYAADDTNYIDHNATITYGKVTNGKVEVTAKFDIDMVEDAKVSFKNQGFEVKDSKTLTITINAGTARYGEYGQKNSTNNGDKYIVLINETPFTAKVGDTITFKKTRDIASSNSEVLMVDKNGNSSVTAMKPGTANITGIVELIGKEYNVNYKGTVVAKDGTNPPESGDDKDKEDPPTPGDDKDNATPTPIPGDKTNTFKWMDASKVKATATSDKYKYISVQTNIKPNEDAHYYVYFSKKADEDVTYETIKNTKDYARINKNKEGILEYKNLVTNINELSGDTYMYIIESCMNYKDVNYGKDKVIVKAQKVEKDKLPAYGERLDIFVVDPNENNAFSNLGTTKTRKLNYKIGKINSDDILRAFKNESSDSAFKKLYDYAKSTKILKEGTISMGDSKPNIVSDMKLDDNGYYFIYLSLDTENGKYDAVDDITIYRAITDDGKNKMIHFAFNTIDVKDKEESKEEKKEEDKKDSSQAPSNIPQTGATSTIAIITGITLAVGTVGFIGYRKYNGVK